MEQQSTDKARQKRGGPHSEHESSTNSEVCTLVVAIIAIVLTVATGATLIELNQRGRSEFDELEVRLSDLDAKYHGRRKSTPANEQ